MSDQHDFEQRLHEVAADAAGRARLQAATDIRRRAGRRRATQVAASGVATVLVVAGIWAVAAPGSEDTGAPPAGAPTGPSSTLGEDTSPPTTDAPTTSGPELPPQEPGPTGGPWPAALPAQEPPAGGWVTTLPDNPAVVLPHYGQQAEFAEEGDWERVTTTDSWLLLPCDADERTGYPSDSTRTAQLAIGQTGVESYRAEQVAVYPSDVEAMRAWRELHQALADCQAERTVRAADETYTDSYWGWRDAVAVTRAGDLEPDEALQAWNWNRTYTWDGSPQYGLGGGFFTLVRVGNVIVLTMADGETDWGAPGAVDEVSVPEAKTIRAVMPALCDRYAAGAC